MNPLPSTPYPLPPTLNLLTFYPRPRPLGAGPRFWCNPSTFRHKMPGTRPPIEFLTFRPLPHAGACLGGICLHSIDAAHAHLLLDRLRARAPGVLHRKPKGGSGATDGEAAPDNSAQGGRREQRRQQQCCSAEPEEPPYIRKGMAVQTGDYTHVSTEGIAG